MKLKIHSLSRQMSVCYKNSVTESILARSSPPVLKKRLLTRQQDGNKLRINNMIERLEFKKHGIKCQNISEIIKCLYPTKFSRLRLGNGSSYGNKQLEKLGRDLLLLTVNQTFLNLFKKSQQDIAGFDFNFGAKMNYMSSWKKNHLSLIRRFLKWNDLIDLARLPAPRSQVPQRIQIAFDQKTFDAIIGYISVTNDPEAVNGFLKEKVAKQIAQNIILG